MRLSEYKRKRNFKKTSEPAGAKNAKTRSKEKRFVIQKHAASRLHYDFRLELEGTLKSWAIPKGPSFDPKDKRLAVHVEDHPLDYATFEGTIPKGEYGGGTVMVWDVGTWESLDPNPHQSYAKGRMKFALHGKKLQGGWALIRMAPRGGDKGDNWLLIKEKDEFAQSDEDVTEVMPDSAATGRSLEQIAAGKDAVWKSSRRSKKVDPDKPKRKTRANKTVGVASTASPSKIALAVKGAMPRNVSPQLCTLVDSVPTGDEWLHEVKFDGYRIVAFIKDGKTELMSRNGKPWTSKFPGIVKACSDIAEACVLDGEVVALREDGTTDFQSLQNFLGDGPRAPLAYYVFDLLHLNGFDLTKCTLRDRKVALRQLLGNAQHGPLRYSEHIEGNGENVYSSSCRLGLEGVVSKQADAAYIQKRSRSWVKAKCLKGQEFVIGGYTEPSGSRSSFGALLLGYYDNDGDFVYAGRVGTGFTEKSLQTIAKLMRPHYRKKTAFASPPAGAQARGVHWLEPKLVCEVEFTEWTQDGQLRHPSFKGIREDKRPLDIIREVPRAASRLSSRGASQSEKVDASEKPSKKTVAPRKGKSAPATIGGVTISNPVKELYPEGITKQMLAEYYDGIADRMLPYIAGRPLSLVRCPDGRTGQCFYQKHISKGLPKSVRTVPIREKKGTEDYLTVEDKEGLLGLVNLGVLEFHIWGCHSSAVERPDILVFDLDPGPDVKGQELVNAAHLLRDHLRALGLKSFLKTTGGKGYHIAAPLEPKVTWDDLKAVTQAIAAHMAETDPGKYTANMSKAKRSGKIYIDYLRNGRGATFIAPYSTRARENSPISMPLEWKDLTAKTKPDGWTLLDATPISRKDPWRELLSLKQSIATEHAKPKRRT